MSDPPSPIQATENSDYQQNQTTDSTYKRQPSIRPHFPLDSVTPLSKDVVDPPFPESLPTTPGYEINHDQMFNTTSPLNEINEIPTQQLPIRPLNTRKDSKPDFPYNQNKRMNTLESFNNLLKHGFKKNQTDAGPLELTDLNDLQHTTSATDNEMSIHNPPRNKMRVIAACGWIFLAGLSDAAPGAILPLIERYYNISYSIVSLIWMANAVGYLLVALVSNKLQPILGKRNALIVGAGCSSINYVLAGTGTKFPVVVLGFVFGGIGIAINISQVNVFLSRLKHSERYLGFFHGSYGFGATISPLIATGMTDRGIKWHYYYFILFGLMFINIFTLGYTFNNADYDLKPWDYQEELVTSPPETPALEQERLLETPPASSSHTSNITNENADNSDNNDYEPVVPKGDMQLVIRNKVTWLISLFVFFYNGGEVALGGWIVTFLLDYRRGNPSSIGYVASGFWFGLTLGRFILTPIIASQLGSRRGVFLLIMGAIVFVILTWVIDHVIIEGLFVSIAGIFIGPIYPLLIALAAKILPKRIQVISLTVMTAFGSSGGAVHPFIIGLISQYCGTYVVLPYFIALFSTMSIGWMCLPNVERKVFHSVWWRNIW